MTAEQALGKAGGLVSAVVDPELRLLRRRELEGDLTANDAELALKSAIYARLKAQIDLRLAGRGHFVVLRLYLDAYLF